MIDDLAALLQMGAKKIRLQSGSTVGASQLKLSSKLRQAKVDQAIAPHD
jgi:hypothetical protein